MKRVNYSKALDAALLPLGFKRNRDEWSRVRGNIRETVFRQKMIYGGGGVSLDVMACDIDTEKLYLDVFESWGIKQGPVIQKSVELLRGKYSRVWSTTDPDGPADLIGLLFRDGLPWFDEVRTLEDQAEHWYRRSKGRDVNLSGYAPYEMIMLALTLHRMGEYDEAMQVLNKPPPRTVHPMAVERVAMARAWLERQTPLRPQA